MQLTDVSTLAEMMARLSVTELEYLSPDGARIHLVRSNGPCWAPIGSPLASPAHIAQEHGPAVRAAVAVPAGMSGIFHRSPAPGEPPFITEGDTVEEGQTLGLMEAMKMLVPVEAPVAGVVGSIHVENGTAVHPATVLMDIIGGDER